MKTDDQVKGEKMQYNTNREAEKISALSSEKIAKFEYFTSEELLTCNQKQTTKESKFTYFPFGKVQISAIKEHGKQMIEPNKVAKITLTLTKGLVLHVKEK